MKKLSIIALIALTFGFAAVEGRATTLDAYGGVSSTSCTNPNGTNYFGLVKYANHILFCDPAGHLFFGRGFAPFQDDDSANDENGESYVNYWKTKYADSTYTYMDAEIPRAKSWGFNMAGPESSSYAMPYWNWSPGTNPNKWPFVASGQSSVCYYATLDSYPYAPQPVKNLYYVTNTRWHGTGYAGYGYLADYEDPNWLAYVAGEAPSDYAGIVDASASDRSYLLGVTGCDSDYMHGFGAGPMYATQTSTGENDFRLSYLVALASPVAWVGYKSSGFASDSLYPDPTVYAKKAWHDQLASEYTTVAALNTAWGTDYSTLGTSGTCYGTHWPSWICPSASAAFSLGTGNGSTTTFSGTLNTSVSPNSVGIFVNGNLVGGDPGNGDWAPMAGGATEPLAGNMASQSIAQVGAAGSSTWSYEVVMYPGTNVQFALPVITTTTGALDPSSSVYNQIKISGANAHAQCNVYRTSVPAGSSVTTTGLIGTFDTLYGINDTGQTGDGSTAPAPTVGQIASGSITYASGAISVTFVSAPPASDAITVEYIANGWQYGTGLMDEAGQNTAWVGDNSICIDGLGIGTACAAGGGTSYLLPGMVADFNILDETLAGAYASAIHAQITKYVPGAIDMGPQPWGGYTTPPNQYVMTGMKPYVNLMDVGGGGWLTQAEIDYIHQYLGDIGIMAYSYASANFDSPFAWPNTPCSYSGSGPYTITCTAATPIANWGTSYLMMSSCADTSYNFGALKPTTVATATGVATFTVSTKPATSSTTCNVAFSDSETYATQSARATAIAAQLANSFSTTYTADGVHPFCTFLWWSFTDMENDNGSRTDWGLVDTRDNAYNGIETTTATIQCASPLNTYSCGGELRSGWGTDDGITPIVTANQTIDSDLAGLPAGAPPTLTNGSISNGTIH